MQEVEVIRQKQELEKQAGYSQAQAFLQRYATIRESIPKEEWQKLPTGVFSLKTVIASQDRIGSPASHPKHRGKSPVWPLGKLRSNRPYCPTVKKGFSKRKKVPEDIAS